MVGDLAGPLHSYPCAEFDWAKEQRQQKEAALAWRVEPELDWYDQQLRDEEEAEHRRKVAWISSLTEAELDELERQTRLAANAPGGLRAELAAYCGRARSAGEIGR